MQIDDFTILLSGLLIRTVLAVLFLVFWIEDRRAIWFGWWSATFFFADLTTVFFIAGGITATFFSVGAGTASLLAAVGCSWQGARAFEGRPPMWLPLLAVPVLWLGLCLIPAFLTNTELRVVVSSILLAPMIAMTSVEFWRGREKPLASRWPVIVLVGSLAVVFAVRIPLLGMLPFPFGALPMQATWLAWFNLILILHTVALAVLFVALSRERLEREQQQKAQSDLLTGALNRRALMSYGERLISRHRRAELPLSLLLLDIDHFKLLNDRMGHLGGDEVLTNFVATVRENIRPDDFLFRMGGDEFCCLLPETTAGQAHHVAERVRGKFEAVAVNILGNPTNVTASMGIASTETFGYALDVLMHEADLAVYAAKRQGRNRVVVATRPAATGPGLQPAARLS